MKYDKQSNRVLPMCLGYPKQLMTKMPNDIQYYNGQL